mmetsp:Transcript_162/g.614  ORF Transcript_162/g.614 Transcript_162/m.614 type:complete len:234 (-) Transcript_162:1724-2425(-)
MIKDGLADSRRANANKAPLIGLRRSERSHVVGVLPGHDRLQRGPAPPHLHAGLPWLRGRHAQAGLAVPPARLDARPPPAALRTARRGDRRDGGRLPRRARAGHHDRRAHARARRMARRRPRRAVRPARRRLDGARDGRTRRRLRRAGGQRRAGDLVVRQPRQHRPEPAVPADVALQLAQPQARVVRLRRVPAPGQDAPHRRLVRRVPRPHPRPTRHGLRRTRPPPRAVGTQER